MPLRSASSHRGSRRWLTHLVDGPPTPPLQGTQTRLRRKKAQEVAPALPTEAGAAPDDAALATLELAALWAGLALTPALRETLWLREILALPYAEIARRQNIPIGTERVTERWTGWPAVRSVTAAAQAGADQTAERLPAPRDEAPALDVSRTGHGSPSTPTADVALGGVRRGGGTSPTLTGWSSPACAGS